MRLLLLICSFAAIRALPPSTSTVTVTSTSTSTTTTTETYRAGLVLYNSLTISGVDAYKKEFAVDNVADVQFVNSALNIFAVPKTATCAYISMMVVDPPEDLHRKAAITSA
jgi:hypothetical protein